MKALDRFGTFSHVGQLNGACTAAQQGPAAGATICRLSTFVWTNARYSSAYVEFDHKDLLDSNNKLLQSMTPSEMALYRKYAEGRGRTKLERLLYAASDNPTTHRLPLVYVGGYVQTVSQLMNVGVISESVEAPRSSTATGFLSGLPFTEIRDALVSGKDPQGATGLNYSINAEANIITALICHADLGRPSSVCRRPAIRQILRHVK